MNRKHLLIGSCAAVAVAGFFTLRVESANNAAPMTPMTPVAAVEGNAIVSVEMPQITGNGAIGQRIFETVCADCHGTNAVGVEGSGPPLIHKIYEPGHHGDEAFQRAVAVGVKSHHWRFGNMPQIQGLTRGDVTMIVAYIRQIQRANGID